MAKRKFWQRPALHFEEEENKHRKVTWLELFFDLYFVVVIAALTHNLAGMLNWQGILDFALTFIPVWWIWIGVTYYNERFETEGFENRLFIFLLMIPIAGLAVFSHDALGHNFIGFVLSYALARAITVFMWAYATYHNRIFRRSGLIYVIGFSLSILLCLFAVLLPPFVGIVVFGLAMTIDLIVPMFAIKANRLLPKFSTSKLPERFGLFIIIVLGEGIVGTINGISQNDHIGTGVIYFGILGIAITFSLWWIYFDFIGRRTADNNSSIKQFAWTYAHLPLVICFSAVGASMTGLIGNVGDLDEFAKITLLIASGGALIVMGCIEPLLKKNLDEPTHYFVSPLLKIITGSGIILFSFFSEGIPSKLVMGIILAFFIVNMIYALYVWFTQDIDDTEDIEVDIGGSEES